MFLGKSDFSELSRPLDHISTSVLLFEKEDSIDRPYPPFKSALLLIFFHYIETSAEIYLDEESKASFTFLIIVIEAPLQAPST